MKSLKKISDEIIALEALRDYTEVGLSPTETETLAILNFCYDLLTRTNQAQSLRVKQPEEIKQPGFDDEYILKYGIASNPLADIVFAIETKQGEISFRKLLDKMIRRSLESPRQIALQSGVSVSSLSEYLNGKYGINIRSYEKIVNYLIREI